jgi:hypothetical protein
MAALRGYLAEHGLVERMLRSESTFVVLGFLYIGLIMAASL